MRLISSALQPMNGEPAHVRPVTIASEDLMPDPMSVTASKTVDGETVSAEFLCDTGRLRVVGGGKFRLEWFPPHSWIAIASVSGNSKWGTRPDEEDLLLLIDNVASAAG
jgi:hypothetical protein